VEQEIFKKDRSGGKFQGLGRLKEKNIPREKLIKKKEKERNRIEGIIGQVKNYYNLGRIKYRIKGGAEIRV